MNFLFLNKTLRLINLKMATAINAKISVFVICVKAIMYFLLYNLHDCTFNDLMIKVRKFSLFRDDAFRTFLGLGDGVFLTKDF